MVLNLNMSIMFFVPSCCPDALYQKLEDRITKTNEKVEQLGQELETLKVDDVKSGELNNEHSR